MLSNFYVNKENEYLVNSLIRELSFKISMVLDENTIFLCIGSDKCIADSFGPIVGSLLSTKEEFKNKVFGTLSNPVNAFNIEKTVKFIRKKYPMGKILAIDACVGKGELLGKISFKNQPLYPGLALGKKIEAVGNFSLTAVVTNEEGSKAFLGSTSLGFIFEIAQISAFSIFLARQTAFYSSINSYMA